MEKKANSSLIKPMYVLLLIIVFILIGSTVMLPRMNKAREDAFRVEATKVIKSASEALKKVQKSELQMVNNDKMCQIGNKMCFTVKELIRLGLYDGKESDYSGRVDLDITNSEKTQYGLYFRKNDEFKIIGGIMKDYTTNGILSKDSWKQEFDKCTCE